MRRLLLPVHLFALAALLGPWASQILIAQAPKPRLSLERHKGWIQSLRFSPDGKTLTSAGSDGIRFWDVATGQDYAKPKPRFQTGSWSFLSPDGKILAASGRKPGLWEVASGKMLATLDKPGIGYRTAFSRDGKMLATCVDDDSGVFLFDAASGKQIATFDRKRNVVRGVAFGPDGTLAAVGGAGPRGDMGIDLWDVAEKAVKTSRYKNPPKTRELGYEQVAYSPNGKFLAVTTESTSGGVVVLLDSATLEPKNGSFITFKNDISLSFSSDSRFLAAGSGDGEIAILDVTTNKKTTFTGHPKGATIGVIEFSPDGKTLASAGGGVIKLWNVVNGEVISK